MQYKKIYKNIKKIYTGMLQLYCQDLVVYNVSVNRAESEMDLFTEHIKTN